MTVIGAGVTVVAFATAFFLKEIPLRRVHREEAAAAVAVSRLEPSLPAGPA